MYELLTTALQQNNLQLTDQQISQLITYLDLLQKWNRVFNLTAITDPKEMIYLHLMDCLLVSPFITSQNCLDIGSGAGLPGIPLAITHPEQHWTLLDKNIKKTQFLTQVVAELSLNNINIIHDRVENLQKQKFDSITCRAFGTLALFANSTRHLLNTEGRLIAMKGKYPSDELNDLPADFKLDKISKLDIKGMQLERHIVVLKKAEE